MSESSVLVFGGFELNAATGELRQKGDLVRLAPQPFRVLELLVRRGGDLVTRAEIRAHVWAGDTFVDFEQGLNFCIRQIREVLGDTADAPRFIETLPRRGYRFLMPVLTPDAEFLAFSLPEALTSSLGGLQSLVVRSSMAAARFVSEPLDPKRVGAEADVDVILTGTLLRAGNE